MDTYAGTIYRDLTDAESQLELARFHEANTNKAEAIRTHIDAAIQALQAARTKLG